jgi:hypothetical protein
MDRLLNKIVMDFSLFNKTKNLVSTDVFYNCNSYKNLRMSRKMLIALKRTTLSLRSQQNE